MRIHPQVVLKVPKLRAHQDKRESIHIDSGEVVMEVEIF